MTDSEGHTPWHDVACRSYVHIVPVLLEYNAGACAIPNNQGRLPLHEAAARHGRLVIMEILLKHSAEACNVKDNDGLTPLHTSVINARLEAVKFLLEHSTEACNMQDNDGSTPLHCAVLKNDVVSTKILLEYNTEACATKDGKGRTPLCLCAAIDGDEAIAAILLEHSREGTGHDGKEACAKTESRERPTVG